MSLVPLPASVIGRLHGPLHQRPLESWTVIELFEQGAQRFLREHPATKVYAALINRYSAVVKQLIDLLPDGDKQKTEADELMAFVKRRSK